MNISYPLLGTIIASLLTLVLGLIVYIWSGTKSAFDGRFDYLHTLIETRTNKLEGRINTLESTNLSMVERLIRAEEGQKQILSLLHVMNTSCTRMNMEYREGITNVMELLKEIQWNR